MYREHRIAAVVPAYNEELLIGPTLDTMPEFVDRIYVVDDCSTDQTAARVAERAARDPRVVSIRHEENRGVGAAIVTGYEAALTDGLDVVAVMAGDNQMDPMFLPKLLDPIVDGKADYAVGNRLINPEFRKGMSRWRFMGNAVLTLLTKIASGYWQLMDPQNGYTAISLRALETIPLDAIYPRYGYCNDLLVRLNVYGFHVKNVPHPARYGPERSGIRYGRYIVRLSRLLLKDFLWRLKTKYVFMNFHPLVFFYLFGVAFSATSIIMGVYSLHYKFVQGYPIFVPAVITLLMFGLGVQFLLFAMLFDMQAEKNGGWY
ncbi:glycosyltransferase family 2 protein [Methanoculleus sp. 7T]|uniref:glycosyltransferase family 2 protein n=1 Tax=Methanoculleus sp. 7T TaxID=2937282 RepID=UPI0020C0C15A|nr:glycosyltransferase family 2 protein [Methanoculleus sp. 7T]MCK8517545.1 glycosyltransferase family 2 protein [Methanoculleus sp. 7T]